ncbi:MAG TPA: homoserine kinase [Candidatus Angelobacter sp.]|nr:homoserine kinase [Candidatus Angelobacter sp.]
MSLNNSEYGWRVIVPATSANLGCAFDCGGLALKLYLKARFIPSSTGKLDLQYRGKTPERFPLEDSNLVLHSLRFAAERLNAPEPAGHVLVESEIPISVGLGSSAAAVIAGLLLGARHADHEVAPEQILRWAEEIEGHIDNAAAAYYGGLVLALCNNVDQVTTLRTNFPEHLRLVIVTPSISVPTHEARQVLPKTYDRADVLHTLQRTAILAATCFAGRFDLFPALFEDKLHQPYRQKLVPGMERCLQLRREGLLGVAISGSGSSVIAFTAKNEKSIADDLQKIFSDESVQTEVLFTSADNNGAGVTREPALSNQGRF